jgi:GNAT superfamily N-acetyltransferase
MITIRRISLRDVSEVLEMMEQFYDSPAVVTATPREALKRDLSDCVRGNPLVAGYVFDDGGTLAGFALVSQGYATDCGGRSIWLEDLYIKPEYRSQGLATRFLAFMEETYPAVRYRLEVEEDNHPARRLYARQGYRPLNYLQMTKDPYNCGRG